MSPLREFLSLETLWIRWSNAVLLSLMLLSILGFDRNDFGYRKRLAYIFVSLSGAKAESASGNYIGNIWPFQPTNYQIIDNTASLDDEVSCTRELAKVTGERFGSLASSQ